MFRKTNTDLSLQISSLESKIKSLEEKHTINEFYFKRMKRRFSDILEMVMKLEERLENPQVLQSIQSRVCVKDKDGLTETQRKVKELMDQGHGTNYIARALGTSPPNIAQIKRRMNKALTTQSQPQAL